MTSQQGWVYILRCCDGSYYVGSTTDLELRVAQHKAGEGGRYTAARLPLTFVYAEAFPDIYQAYDAERQVKGWSRARGMVSGKKEALIAGRYKLLRGLARSRQRRPATRSAASPSA